MRQAFGQHGIILLDDGQDLDVPAGITDDAYTDVFPGQILFHQYGAFVAEFLPDLEYGVFQFRDAVTDTFLSDAEAGIPIIGLDDHRERDGDVDEGGVFRFDDVGVGYRDIHFNGKPPGQGFVVAVGQALGSPAGVRDIHHFQQGRYVQFKTGVVQVPFIAQIQDQVEILFPAMDIRQVAVMIVDEFEIITLQGLQGVPQQFDRMVIVVIECGAGFHPILPGGIPHQDTNPRSRFVGRSCFFDPWFGDHAGDQVAPGHHTQILVAVGLCGHRLFLFYLGEAVFTQEVQQGLQAVEPLAVELIGDHAFFHVGDDFSRDQPLVVGGEGSLPANEVVLVYPLPTARFKGLAHVVTIGDVDQQLASRSQHPTDFLEDLYIILLGLEIAKTVPQHGDDAVLIITIGQLPGVPFPETDGKAALSGKIPGPADEVMGTIHTMHIPVPEPRHLQHMTALSAAQIEDRRILIHFQYRHEDLHFLGGDLLVIDDISVRAQVIGIEDMAPPIRANVAFQVFNRSQHFNETLVIRFSVIGYFALFFHFR